MLCCLYEEPSSSACLSVMFTSSNLLQAARVGRESILGNGSRDLDLPYCFLYGSLILDSYHLTIRFSNTDRRRSHKRTIVNMKRTKERLKRIVSCRAPHDPEPDSQRLPTYPLKVFAEVLDALPVPGAGALAHSILSVFESVNVRAQSIVLNF